MYIYYLSMSKSKPKKSGNLCRKDLVRELSIMGYQASVPVFQMLSSNVTNQEEISEIVCHMHSEPQNI